MKRPFMIVCILLIIMCVLRLYIFDDAPPPEVIPKETVTFQGRIDYWETDADRTILYLSNVFFYGDSAEEISTYKLNGIRCYLKSRDGYKLGQSVVVQQGLVLGVEGIEGTDKLIIRCGDYKRKGVGGVLVKLRKPQQDMRIDLPTFGVKTIENAHASGLRGVALHAGNGLIVDETDAIKLANKLGMFIIGINPADYMECN